MTVEELRVLLMAEVDTGLAFREARSSLFVRLVEDGMSMTLARYELNVDEEVVELERAYLVAKAEARLAMLDARCSELEAEGDGEGDE